MIIDFGKSVAMPEAVNLEAKPIHAMKLYSYVAPELLDRTGKPSLESNVFSLACIIKSVYMYVLLLKIKNLPIAVKRNLASSSNCKSVL